MPTFFSEPVRRDLDKAESVRDVFELVQDAVRNTINESRAGLNLGIMELGNQKGQFLGAFYPMGSNVIVLNQTPLRRIAETKPDLMNAYVFQILLHEYLHSLGYLDEATVRKLCIDICRRELGNDHPATQMARDIRKFFPNITYPGRFPAAGGMKLIEDLDRGMDYID